MKIFLNILFLISSISGFAQSNGKYIQLTSQDREAASIIWLSTKITGSNAVDLQVKFFASFPIDENHISLIINGNNTGSKAEIVSLYGNAEHEYTYERKVELPERSNQLQLVLQGPKAEYTSSVLEIKDQEIRILPDGDLASRILWIFPDPSRTGGYHTRMENTLLNYKALIKTGVKLTNKSCMSIALNDRQYPAKNTDVLRKTGEGMYEFQGSVLLNPNIRFNELSLIVDINGNNIKTKPFLITVDQDKPSLFLLSIGTNTNLNYTSKDAKDFADVFRNQDHPDGLFENITIQTLSGYDAESQAMRVKINELGSRMKAGQIKPKDLVVLFISSHGFIEDNELRIQGEDYDPSAKMATSISFEYDVLRILEKMECKKLVFVDACHSGGGAKSNVSDINYEIEKLNSIQKGISTIVSSQEDEQSWEDAQWENGAFTEAIISGLLDGRADYDGNRLITINEIYNHLKIEVPKIVYNVKKQTQNPALLSDELGDVAIYFIQ